MLVNPQSVEKLQQQSLDWYIVKYTHFDFRHPLSFADYMRLGPWHATRSTPWKKSK